LRQRRLVAGIGLSFVSSLYIAPSRRLGRFGTLHWRRLPRRRRAGSLDLS
jgi:hypothetical protein